ncbi:hypothetical protein AQUCO_09300018v1, partial [Aquilegia coerulea]
LGYDPIKLHFCDKSLPYQVRAKDLVGRLTLDEKIAQLGDKAEGVKRLHIPAYNWRSEALHGVSDVGFGTHFDDTIRAATSFPTVLLTAASFNETLWKAVGEAISDEARAMHNVGLSGLTFWSPNVNVATDPRWGRIQETGGEDPFLVSRYGVNYVRGLQDVKGYINVPDKNSRPLKVAACCKYYTAYDMEKWTADPTKKTDRYHFDAQVPDRDMLETYNYPFEMCVKEGDVASIMCSYNRVNGIPTCADPKLLNSTVRGLWGLNGYIVDDCDWVVATVLIPERYRNDTPADAISQAFRAGVDLDCRGNYSPHYMMDAITQGKLSEAEIDHALINLYVVLMRLGWFDGSPGDYLHLGQNDVCSKENLELAAEAARQGIVLLLNDNSLPLPLNYSTPDGSGRKPTVAVVGPHANATTAMLGNYALKTGTACRYVTPLDAIQGYANVKYAPGCLDVNCEDTSGFQEAAKATDGTDATFLFLGLDLSYEDEDSDRQNLYLPKNQIALLDAVFKEPYPSLLVIVVLSGGGVDLSDWGSKVHAILWAGYPGAEGGQAIADILFGKHDPAGRLPISWYKGDYTNKLPMTSMQLRPNPALGYPGRTYKFCTDDGIVFPFGFGMSYTTFNYTISAPKSVSIELPETQKCIHIANPTEDCPSILVANSKCTEMVKIVVTVMNIGQRNGAHVVVLFSSPPDNIGGTLPRKRVVGFQRVLIKSGESLPVEFNLNVCKSFSFISEDANELLPAGDHSIAAGNDFTGGLVFTESAVSTKISIMIHQGTSQTRRIDHL